MTTIRTSEFERSAKCTVRVDHYRTFQVLDPEEFHGEAVHKDSQNFGNWFVGHSEPNWKDHIRNHLEATTLASGRKWKELHATPASVSVKQIAQSKVSPFYQRDEVTYSLNGVVPGLGPNRLTAPQDVRDDVHARHVAKAMSKIDQIRGSLASGEDVGEFTQTVRMLASPFKSLRKELVDYIGSIAKFKRARLDKKSFMKAVTDTYLEYNFGVRPLESSISHIVTELQRQGSRMDFVPFSVTTSKEYGGTTGSVDISLPSMPVTITYGIQTKNRYVERWQGEVKSSADEDGNISTVKMLGLTPDKWAPTIYNLIPYSFVLDYVLNVGDIVNALSFRTSDIAWCCVTTRNETSTRYSSKSVVRNNQDEDDLLKTVTWTGGGTGGQQFFECVEFYRDRLRKTDFLIPIQVKIPDLWEKPWLNVAALLNSGFRAKNTTF